MGPMSYTYLKALALLGKTCQTFFNQYIKEKVALLFSLLSLPSLANIEKLF